MEPEDCLRSLAAEALRWAPPHRPLFPVSLGLMAVANAFVMLGLLPEPRAEAVLADHKSALEREGLGNTWGVTKGELTVRPGAHEYWQSRMAGPGGRGMYRISSSGHVCTDRFKLDQPSRPVFPGWCCTVVNCNPNCNPQIRWTQVPRRPLRAETGCLGDLAELTPDVGRVQRRPDGRGEHQAVILPQGPGRQPVSRLTLTVLPERLHGSLGQRQCPPRPGRLGVAILPHRMPYGHRRRHGLHDGRRAF